MSSNSIIYTICDPSKLLFWPYWLLVQYFFFFFWMAFSSDLCLSIFFKGLPNTSAPLLNLTLSNFFWTLKELGLHYFVWQLVEQPLVNYKLINALNLRHINHLIMPNEYIRLRWATPRLRSGVVAETSYPMSEIRSGGWDELTHARGQGQRPRGATTCPRSGVAAEKNNPMSKEWWLRGRRRAERSYSTFEVRRGGGRRYPSSKVRSSGCALLEQPSRDTTCPR